MHGIGICGSISLRNRTAMILAIEYGLSQVQPEKRATAYRNWGQTDRFFVSKLLEMNSKGLGHHKVATREATLKFSALGGHANNLVLLPLAYCRT